MTIASVVRRLFSLLFGLSTKPAMPMPVPESTGMGAELRQRMLVATPAEMGQRPTPEFPRVYGVLMDWPLDEQYATIVSTSTGAASLYTTSSFGIIGGEAHEKVRDAAKAFVRAADALFEVSSRATTFPYPPPDRLRFNLLTFDGVRVLETDLDSIEEGTNPYTPIFALGQAVLTELRLTVEPE